MIILRDTVGRVEIKRKRTWKYSLFSCIKCVAMKMIVWTLMFLMFGFVCFADDSCAPVPVQSNFNITTFTSAPWYAQVGQPVIYLTKNELYCVVANYTLTGPTSVGVYNYANVGEVNGPVHDGNICAVVPDTTEPAKLAVGPCFLPSSLYGPYWVVLAGPDPLNYEYALISGGQPTINTGNGCKTGEGVNGSGLWVFSRDSVAPQSQIDMVIAQAKQLGYDTSVLLPNRTRRMYLS